MAVIHLSLGSNLGNKEQNIALAIALLASDVGTIIKQTEPYTTEPWRMETEHKFLNAVVVLDTKLSPLDLLQTTQRIERQLGRTRTGDPKQQYSSTRRYEDRLIDIDILYYDDLHLSTPDLVIPHPLIEQRPFVRHGLELLNHNI